ncbi:hypothetical protein GSI_10791 [Ganoderma sinense ZZ0214-1]|uniref:Uncharacterized protein n=1 Tax=Ganoderma sinense ZZ0214-1 TaxID=1077348 RepID=A0A2G8S1J5_9APHY|nr:hypothetical protein GSI_10791 [Ganoderma sinense ZZ0214-1]
MSRSGRLVYVPTTSHGWVPYPAQPFNSEPPPVPVGVHCNTWHTGDWQVNPAFHCGTHVPDRETWLPHPAWYIGNHSAQPPVADISRVLWLWVPRGVDVDDLRGHPASRSNGHFQGLQPEVSLPPPITASSPPAFVRVRASERVRHGRDTPHPHPGRLLPADDTYSPSPDYGPFRVNASPRIAGASSQQHARAPSRSNTYSPFSSPEPSPVIPPAVIPSSSSSYHPPPANPSGLSSHAHARHYPSSSSYRGLPPRNNPLPRPPEHHPLAQSLLRNANRPMAADAPVVPDRRR